MMRNKDDCEDVVYEYGRWKRLQKRNEDINPDASAIWDLIMSQSQKDGWRKRRKDDRSEDEVKSNSRSWSRKSTSSQLDVNTITEITHQIQFQ